MGYLRLYQKQNYNILKDFITIDKVEEILNVDRSNFQAPRGKNIEVQLNDKIQPVVPNPEKFSLQKIYLTY